jgi:ketosteroid isomerase-like protein
MTTANDRTTAESQIRTLIDDRVKAVRARDMKGAYSSTANDILSFDVVNPLQYAGDASRKHADEWFSSFDGPIGYEVRDLSVTTSDDVAFSHCLNRFSGRKADGAKIDMWVRATTCYRKNDGKWMITHEHMSVPFDVASGKASLDLQP